jgi:beta-mannosidase
MIACFRQLLCCRGAQQAALWLVFLALVCARVRAAEMGQESLSTKFVPRELFLSGEDWKIASFDPGQGMPRRAFSEGYPTSAAIAAVVPGDIHADLERAGKIPPIYYGLNSQNVGWVAGMEWWYRKTFATPIAWRDKTVRLCFDAVDNKADVWLNDRSLGRHEGQFTPFEFDVTGLLRGQEENVLTVLIHPAPAEVRNSIAAGTGEWPVMQAMRQAYPFWKCMTNAGWDWGAKIITIGIWKDVWLIASEGVSLSSPIVLPQLTPPYDRATLRIGLKLRSDKSRPATVRYRVRCLTAPDTPTFAIQRASLASGEQQPAFSMDVPHPQLWWPNGYGRQHLYELDVEVLSADGARTLDRARTTFGIRDLKMLQNPEAVDNLEYIDYTTDQPVTHRLQPPLPERKYLIQINGRKIFARGGNWIPCDLLYGRPRRPFYEHLIRTAAEGNFNLFRVWGGGLIDKPEFYDLCDRYGIMLFQEFPNGGARLSETNEALAITGGEARQILPLLLNHPCIVRYGGGNEWYRNAQNSRQMAQLRKICNEVDPTRPFHDPDPECIAQRHGPHSYDWNLHYRTYNVGYPLTAGPDNPLEWTEYGASGAASIETLRRIMPAEHLWPIRPSDPYWIWHKAFGAYGDDNWMGSTQYTHLFGALGDLETTVRASQFVQAEGLRYANQAMRRFQWHRSGCAFWTYNEPWPNAAHGCVVEYYGRPKMAFYYTKQSYAPVDVSAQYPSIACKIGTPFPLQLFVTSDRAELLKDCRLTATVVDVHGRPLDRKSWQLDVAAESTHVVGTLELNPPENFAGNVVLVHVQIRDSEGRDLSTETYTFGVAGRDSADASAVLQVPVISADGRRNLALLPGVKAAASSVLPGYDAHKIAHLNDGWYGNEASWIEGESPSWAQVDLGAVYTISRICAGNDHTLRFTDRGIRELRILAGTEYNVDSGAPAWRTVATYKGEPLRGGKRFDFAPTRARWIRIAIDSGAGSRIDEVEVYEAQPLPASQWASARAAVSRGPVPVVPGQGVPSGCLRSMLTAPLTELALAVHPENVSERANSSELTYRIAVRNRGKVPALFVKLETHAEDPKQWHFTNNYFTLLSGETQEIKMVLENGDVAPGPVCLWAKAWNSTEASQTLPMASSPNVAPAVPPSQSKGSPK